jgi:hypothetical protein
VETLKLSNEETLIAAVNHDQYILFKISRLGELLEENAVDLDLHNASDISVSMDREGFLTIFYLEEDLFRVLIDLETLEYERIKVAENVEYFKREGQVLVYQYETDLYALNVEDDTRNLLLREGPIKSFALDQDEKTGLYHLITTIRKTLAVDISYVEFNDQLKIQNDFLLKENTESQYIQYVETIHAKDNIITAVFVWSDRRYKNNVTVHQYDMDNLKLITDYHHDFSLLNSRYIIEDVTDEQVTMIFQDKIKDYVNVVKVVMTDDKEAKIIPLSKTRKYSLLSDYYKLGSEQALIFFDLVNTDKIIYFASSSQILIDQTTKAATINPLRILGLAVIVVVQATMMSAIFYIIFVVIGPFITLLILNKYLPNFKSKIYIQNAVSAILHTGLKFILTYYIIHVMGTYILRPIYIGQEPFIYIFMVFSSILSYYLMCRYIKWNIQYDTTEIQSYLHFIAYEYMIYTLVVYIYVVSYMIISKL